MPALSAPELELLDFLCEAAFFRCRVGSIRSVLDEALHRLRCAGLVQMDGFVPTPWTFNEWMDRQDGERLVQQLPDAPAAAPEAEPVVPPEPRAEEGGGGAAARNAKALPPISAGQDHSSVDIKVNTPTGAELADELERLARLKGWPISRLAYHLLNGPSGITRLWVTQPKPATIAKIRAFIADPPEVLPTRADLVGKPMVRGHDLANRRLSVETRRRHMAEAERRIDAGLPAGKASSVHVKIAQLAMEERRAEAIRLADPIEQAKRKLQRRYAPVCSAETAGGPEGMYVVGRKLVDVHELLAMAERMAA